MQNKSQNASNEYCSIKITILHTPPSEKADLSSNMQTLASVKYNLSPGLDIEDKLSNALLENKCKTLLDSKENVQGDHKLLQTLSLPAINCNEKEHLNTENHKFNINPQIQKALTVKSPEKISSGSCSCCVF
ncbi:hypothetical protein SteCoe_8796 [Stentor coeruleus]|uniref:Uncharacterized protein n=1 Tax=Stentor coeruleus TaxID=5963 RepID=A0A1R2CJ96_9CILI|nr:hypothetical protein SteCoe_8796 [Stentor coeruleus]